MSNNNKRPKALAQERLTLTVRLRAAAAHYMGGESGLGNRERARATEK